MKLTLFFILVALSIPAMSDNGEYHRHEIKWVKDVEEISNGTMIVINLSEKNGDLMVLEWCKWGTIVIIPEAPLSSARALCEKQERRKQG